MSTTTYVSASCIGAGAAQSFAVGLAIRLQVIDAWSLRPVAGARLKDIVIDDEAVAWRSGVTDENGVVEISIPYRSATGASYSLSVCFEHFTVLAEPSRREYESGLRDDGKRLVQRGSIDATGRSIPLSGAASWEIAWTGGSVPQSVGDPRWGWHLCPKGTLPSDMDQYPEFLTKILWPRLPGAAASVGANPGDWAAIHRATWGYSMFREADDNAPDLVVFALQATPPVWESAGPTYVVRDGVRVARRELPLGAPLMISRARASGGEDGGRDFGAFAPKVVPRTTPAPNISDAHRTLWESKSHSSLHTRLGNLGTEADPLHYWRPHDGIDVMGASGVTPVFSVCAGEVVGDQRSSSYGNHLHIALRPKSSDGEERIVHYAHLSTPVGLRAGDKVFPGQLIGLMGRTENVKSSVHVDYGKDSPTHVHIELRLKTPLGQSIEPRDLFMNSTLRGHAPAWLLPSNDMPRALPCDCEWGALDPQHCSRLGGSRKSVPLTCWAAKNQACPHGEP